jgi:hypothetical protein
LRKPTPSLRCHRASLKPKLRPTSTTYLEISAEQLSLFGAFNQVVITGGWDITPAHNISARIIRAYYGDSMRAA